MQIEINHYYPPEWLNLKTDQNLIILNVHKEVEQRDLSYTAGRFVNLDNQFGKLSGSRYYS